jgi:hypothetical protein
MWKNYMGTFLAIFVVAFVFGLFIGKVVFKNGSQAGVNGAETGRKYMSNPLVFKDGMNRMEAQGLIFEKYTNHNVRIVGAVVQEVNGDNIVIRTYRAGEGTSTVVKDKKIYTFNDTPVFETQRSLESKGTPVETRKKVDSLTKGDFLVIECAEDESMKDAPELTAVMIMKDVVELPKPNIQ